jgi:isopenicillin N synthase-like dioxygenase
MVAAAMTAAIVKRSELMSASFAETKTKSSIALQNRIPGGAAATLRTLTGSHERATFPSALASFKKNLSMHHRAADAAGFALLSRIPVLGARSLWSQSSQTLVV